MKQISLVIAMYAILILIGGIIGYVAAHSLISLIVSSLFALLLFTCCFFIWKGHMSAYHIAMGTIFCLFAFFCYRFFLTQKIMPAAIMTLISGGIFVYLASARKHVKISI